MLNRIRLRTVSGSGDPDSLTFVSLSCGPSCIPCRRGCMPQRRVGRVNSGCQRSPRTASRSRRAAFNSPSALIIKTCQATKFSDFYKSLNCKGLRRSVAIDWGTCRSTRERAGACWQDLVTSSHHRLAIVRARNRTDTERAQLSRFGFMLNRAS